MKAEHPCVGAAELMTTSLSAWPRPCLNADRTAPAEGPVSTARRGREGGGASQLGTPAACGNRDTVRCKHGSAFRSLNKPESVQHAPLAADRRAQPGGAPTPSASAPEQVALKHIAMTPLCRTLTMPNVLPPRDLHVIDILGVPQRFDQALAKRNTRMFCTVSLPSNGRCDRSALPRTAHEGLG